MILIKVFTSLPCTDESIQSDLARRLTISFKLCCPDYLIDPADVHILFLPTFGYFDGSKFLKPAKPSNTPLAILHLDVVVSSSPEFNDTILKRQILTRLTKEVDEWIASFFHSKNDASTDPSALPDVVPVIEYRRMQYDCHAIDGKVIACPYGVM